MLPRAPAATLLVVLLVAAAGLVVGSPTEPLATRVLAINETSAKPTVPWKGFDGNPPKVFDFDGDGDLEIVAQNDNHWVYVFDSRTGAILAEVTTTIPTGWTPRTFNGPEAAILEHGGKPRLIVANSAAVVTSFVYDPVASTRTHLVLLKEWERRLTDCHRTPGMDAKPVFADLDRDGRLDILAATEDRGVYALRLDGSLLWASCIVGGNAEPGVGDLDLDGWPDVVHGSDLGVVTALDGRTGATKWTFKVLDHFDLGSGSMPIAPTIAQLDGRGGPDIVVGARDSHDATDWTRDHALLLALDSQGRLLWGKQDPGGAPLTYTHPVVVDADGDGQREIYWADWNTVGHYPPYEAKDMWKTTGPAHVYRYTPGGGLVWRQSLPTWWHNKDTPLADLDGDGVQEVIVNGPSQDGAHDGLWTLDSRTGAKERFIDAYPWKVARAPVVADLWGTGTMQLVLEAGQHASAAGGPGILVYDTGRPYSSAWPHVDYPAPPGLPEPASTTSPSTASSATRSSTSATLSTTASPSTSVTSSATTSASPSTSRSSTTTTSPAPSSPSYASTFTVKSPNAWWIELVPKATGHTVVAAHVRIDGGAWKPLAKSDWGTWTSSSSKVARGTPVEFLVTDSAGARSQSAAFAWIDETGPKGSVPLGSPTPVFTATFTPSPHNGRWWVEVRVSANQTVASVAAVVDGQSTTLPKTDWGSYGKSFHVRAGASVVFEARNPYGKVASSQRIVWP